MISIRAAGLSAALVLATLGAAPRALACKCMMPSADMAKEQATAVFEGRVSAIDTEPAPTSGGMDTNIVTLAIVRTWKGLENQETIKVRTSASTASCGIAFEKDQSYLVYASEGAHGLEAGACGRTRPMSEASEDLAAFGAGITPVKVESKPAEEAKKPPEVKHGGCGSTSAKGNATASLFIALPAFGLVAARRRKR